MDKNEDITLSANTRTRKKSSRQLHSTWLKKITDDLDYYNYYYCHYNYHKTTASTIIIIVVVEIHCLIICAIQLLTPNNLHGT